MASHLRSYKKGGHTTVPEHMPKAHRAHLEWTPSRLIDWGKSIGPSTAQLVASILESRTHPEQGYRACLGVLRLAKRVGDPMEFPPIVGEAETRRILRVAYTLRGDRVRVCTAIPAGVQAQWSGAGGDDRGLDDYLRELDRTLPELAVRLRSMAEPT